MFTNDTDYLNDLAKPLGLFVEHVPAIRRRTRERQSARPFHLIGGGRARYFASADAVKRELRYLQGLRDAQRAAAEAAVASQPAPVRNAIDTHAGKVEFAKANETCFACRFYSHPLQRLAGYCALGAPCWAKATGKEASAAYVGDNWVGWANTCERFEKEA